MNRKIMLWDEKKACGSYIKTFLLESDRPAGAVLVIPGGGYQMVCEPSEGRPVAEGFNRLGLHAFVLNYRTRPDSFPAPQQDAMRALKIIRANAKKWNIAENRIGVCGFSAGGHLAASLGTKLVENIDAANGDEADGYSARPDFIISGQGVLDFTIEPKSDTLPNLLGREPTGEEEEFFSLRNHVTADTPPVFLWHTMSDQVVSYRCSTSFAEALTARKVPCELHIFPRGDHGILLGVDTPDVSQWQQLAAKFIAVQTGELPIIDKAYTHFYQCEATDSYPGPRRPGDER